eukprot:6484085-Amphidinium_carterae.3
MVMMKTTMDFTTEWLWQSCHHNHRQVHPQRLAEPEVIALGSPKRVSMDYFILACFIGATAGTGSALIDTLDSRSSTR